MFRIAAGESLKVLQYSEKEQRTLHRKDRIAIKPLLTFGEDPQSSQWKAPTLALQSQVLHEAPSF